MINNQSFENVSSNISLILYNCLSTFINCGRIVIKPLALWAVFLSLCILISLYFIPPSVIIHILITLLVTILTENISPTLTTLPLAPFQSWSLKRKSLILSFHQLHHLNPLSVFIALPPTHQNNRHQSYISEQALESSHAHLQNEWSQY